MDELLEMLFLQSQESLLLFCGLLYLELFCHVRGSSPGHSCIKIISPCKYTPSAICSSLRTQTKKRKKCYCVFDIIVLKVFFYIYIDRLNVISCLRLHVYVFAPPRNYAWNGRLNEYAWHDRCRPEHNVT